MFTDRVVIKAQAGNGGNGVVSFRRERAIAKGGPDGGDGGRGGNIILQADHNLNTLSAFRHKQLIAAENGGAGGRQRRHGKNGSDQLTLVPAGTIILENQEALVDLTADGQQAVVAQGGRGGYGNAHFTSSVRQAPRIAELGEKGEEKELVLELKLLADVGLLGLPNAGKSTLLSVISNAQPEIADYPFTTLFPNLGVVDIDKSSLLVADIPGLIAGASKGKGLGDDFLRHIERTAVLLHLIDAGESDVRAAYKVIMEELRNYTVDLTAKPQIVVLTKKETITAQQLKSKTAALKKLTKTPIFSISAVAHQDILPLLRATQQLVEEQRETPEETSSDEVPVLTLADDPKAWWIEEVSSGLEVKGQQIEGFARRTDFSNPEATARLRDIMRRQGILRELRRMGLESGSNIRIADKTITL